MTNLYTVLGVPKTASPRDIKKAYRKLARDNHPDRNSAPEAEARFKEVNTAHEVLSDPERRKLYDTYGEASLSSGFDPSMASSGRGFSPSGGPDFDVDDLLSSLFGGGRARSVQATLGLDFRTAVLGGERTLQMGDASLKVRIPPGVRDGGVLRLRGKGPGGSDVELRLQVAPDPVFSRNGSDLGTVVPITVPQAMLGARVPVSTLGGQVVLTVPPCTQNGTRLRLRGKGVPGGSRVGDLVVTLEVRLPERLTPELREALGALEEAYDIAA